MKIFTDYQILQMQDATEDETKGCIDLDGTGDYRVYGGPDHGKPCVPDNGVPSTILTLPNNPTVIRGEPTFAPTYRVPGDEFNCDERREGDCFSRIPRDDYQYNVEFNSDTETVTIPLDNVRGMYLCDIYGFVSPIFEPDATFTDVEYQIAVDEFKYNSAITLMFRGQNVPGFTGIQLSDLIAVAGDNCCTAEKLRINCFIPDYGGLELAFTIGGASAPVTEWQGGLGLRFSGCGCHLDKSCCCGKR